MFVTRTSILATVALALLAEPALAQQGLHWETNLQAAQQQALQTNRLLLVHFGATWCRPCMRLEQQVFGQPGFGLPLQENFVAVKLDLDQNRQLATQWGVQGIPADVIVTPQGAVLYQGTSPDTAEKYIGTLQQVATRARAAAVSQIAQAPPQNPPPAAATTPTTPAAAPANTAAGAAPRSMTDDRYAYYFNNGSAGPAAVAPPVASQAAVPAAPTSPVDSPAAGTPPSRYAPQAAAEPPAGQSPATQPPTTADPTRLQLPPGSPPLALDGHCAVTLVEQKRWVPGNDQWGAIHRGCTYVFAGQAEQQRFLANPDYYSPVNSGNDPVLALDQGKRVPGSRQYGVFYGNRIYLFADESTLAQFTTNPSRYAPEITQAMKQ